jgi:hypothetical protein
MQAYENLQLLDSDINTDCENVALLSIDSMSTWQALEQFMKCSLT